MQNSTLDSVMGVGEGSMIFGFTFSFPYLGSALYMNYGQIGDLLTLSIQALSLVYIGMKVLQLGKKKQDGGNL
jgi:hypothetical protein